jgi:hypothetical protein
MAIPADNDQAILELVETEPDLLPTAADGTGFREARQFPRIPFRGRARAIVFPAPGSAKRSAATGAAEPHECEVLTTDVSRGGLSVLYRKQLRPGQQILLMLNETSRRVEVCWCCRVWPGLYAAGCQFLDAEAEE